MWSIYKQINKPLITFTKKHAIKCNDNIWKERKNIMGIDLKLHESLGTTMMQNQKPLWHKIKTYIK
jgi:hypothetical protein